MKKKETRRITRQLSPADKERLKKRQKQIADELPELIKRDQIRKHACEETTLSGELRRAIQASPLSLTVIAKQSGISQRILDDFLTADQTLSSDVLDRLAAILGCHVS